MNQQSISVDHNDQIEVKRDEEMDNDQVQSIEDILPWLSVDEYLQWMTHNSQRKENYSQNPYTMEDPSQSILKQEREFISFIAECLT